MLKLSEAIEPYREIKTGGVSLYLNPSDHSVDNGLLFTSLYMLFLTHEEFVLEREWFNHFVDTHMVAPGLLERYPTGPFSQELMQVTQHDDYTGVMAVGDLSHIRSIYDYGLNHGFCWNLGPIDVDYWLGRLPGFVPALKVASYLPLTWFDQLSFFISCLGIFIEKAEDSTSKILQYLKCKIVFGHYPLCNLGITLWKWRAMKLYPEGIRGVWKVYRKDHPFSDYAPLHFD